MRVLIYAIAAIFALAPSSAARAQHQDLEVTMDVVPLNATPRAPTARIELPANKARSLKGDAGRELGKGASEAPRQRAGDRVPKKPPKAPKRDRD